MKARIYKKCTDPRVFGFGVFLPSKIYNYISKYKKEILPYTKWFIKKRHSYPKSNSMVAHITIKYLMYHKRESNKDIRELIPELKEISKRYLPIKISVKGIKIGTKYKDIGILLNFKSNKKIKDFHKEVLDKLKGKIDIFQEMDGANFSPHIAIGAAEKTKSNLKVLREIAKESRKDKKVNLILKIPYIFFKKLGPKKF